jgi:hypothetical protein
LEVYALMALYFGRARRARRDREDVEYRVNAGKVRKVNDAGVSTGVGFKYIAPKFMELMHCWAAKNPAATFP